MTAATSQTHKTVEPASARLAASQPVRWFHLLVLACLVFEGAVLRFDHLGSDSLWLDEYWSVYRSTGRDQIGHSIFDIPKGVVLDPPPAMGFEGAPPWWTTWTSIASAGGNGPVFGVVLRWWIDLVGTNDFAMRTLPALLSLASVVLMFILLYRDVGPWPALLASALMSLSVYAINFARDLRCYPLMTFLGLCITWVIFSIMRNGPAWWRLALVGFLSFCLVLTHYFALGPLLGIGIFALWRTRGRVRVGIAATLVISGLITAAVWAPVFLKARPVMDVMSNWMHNNPGNQPADWEPMLILSAPTRLLSGFTREIMNIALSHWNAWVVLLINIALFLPLAWITYGWPARFLRKDENRLVYWWVWCLSCVGFVAIVDCIQHYYGIAWPRYYSMALPGVCALVAAYVASQNRRWAMSVVLLVALASMMRGADPHKSSAVDRRPWRQAAAMIDSLAGPHDVLAFTMYDQDLAPCLGYCVYRHYVSDQRPLLLPTAPEPLLRTLANSGKFWVIGDNPTRWHYRGWYVADVHWLGSNLYMWHAVPPPATMPSDTADNIPSQSPR